MTSTTLRCELCQTDMTLQSCDGSPVRYFHCAGCGRWVASNYRDELMRAGTAYERAPSRAPAGDSPDFERIKSRMERWVSQLDERDPYRVLGVAPSAPEEAVRERFHALALENHPDRGGDPAKMRRVLSAWDSIRHGKRLGEERARGQEGFVRPAGPRR